jgi:hypothetical protein
LKECAGLQSPKNKSARISFVAHLVSLDYGMVREKSLRSVRQVMIHGPQGTSQREDAKQSIAHAKRGSGGDGTWAPPHDLEAHLRAVAELAGTAARNFNASDWAHLAGLWHDLGKYRERIIYVIPTPASSSRRRMSSAAFSLISSRCR